MKEKIAFKFDFSQLEKYKKHYHNDNKWIDTVDFFLNCHKETQIDEYTSRFIYQLAEKFDFIEINKAQFERANKKVNDSLYAIKQFEITSQKDFQSIHISDIYKNHHYLTENRTVFVVLGNHEFVDFNNIEEGFNFYQEKTSKLKINLLNNNFSCVTKNNEKYVIFGGTGFAKYNLQYNADTLVCCRGFNREKEITETELFEAAYKRAKTFAQINGACFICVTHYPILDCLPQMDKDVIYFWGHNHRNEYMKNEMGIIYADNQIGYKKPINGFKWMSTGTVANPYFSLLDGLYKTNIKDYLQFSRYIGEDVGEGTMIYQKCKDDRAFLYLIKSHGYYGFFIMQDKGKAKGISIINGGKIKRITESTDFQWLVDNFDVVLSKYIQILVPLRNAQETLSQELKDLGFSGCIHGCIVDINFYHHIMLNPIEGTMTFYYSETFGTIQNLYSFENVISSIKKKESNIYGIDYDNIVQKYKLMCDSGKCMLATATQSYVLERKDNLFELDEKEQVVSIKDGMYGISRKVNPLQRIFSAHVLRDFDVRLAITDTKDNKEIEE